MRHHRVSPVVQECQLGSVVEVAMDSSVSGTVPPHHLSYLRHMLVHPISLIFDKIRSELAPGKFQSQLNVSEYRQHPESRVADRSQYEG